MIFHETDLGGVYLIEAERHEDSRGYFVRLHCAKEFADRQLPPMMVQTNLSYNKIKGTFRGLHYQVPPSKEGKLVRCAKGEVRDLIVDLRPSSPTFLKHAWFTLSADEMVALWVPPGFAHGFITCEDNTSVQYQMSDYYSPELARGMRWDDPTLQIPAIEGITNVHPRDLSYPDVSVNDLEVFRV